MSRRPLVNHRAIAKLCRANPGEWQTVGEYNSGQSADGIAGHIRNATTKRPTQASPYAPAGAFEARRELTEYGARVEARYVGTGTDALWADALASVSGGAM